MQIISSHTQLSKYILKKFFSLRATMSPEEDLQKQKKIAAIFVDMSSDTKKLRNFSPTIYRLPEQKSRDMDGYTPRECGWNMFIED